MTDAQLREIQGYLDAFEQLNHGPGRECCFEFEPVEWRGDLEGSLEAHFAALPGTHPHWTLTAEKMPTGVDGLRPVLEAWFFGATFGGLEGGAARVTPGTRRACAEQFVQFLTDFFGGEHPRVWRLFVRGDGGEANPTADDFALEREHRVYWLHFDWTE
jgi:hypothetical protein